MISSPSHSNSGSTVLVIRSIFACILLALSVLSASCTNTTKPEEAAKIQISNLLNDLEDAVREYNIEEVTKNLHDDFMHNGKDDNDIILVWYQRLMRFNHLSIDERQIVVMDYLAQASFRMTFTGADTTLVSEEPSEEFGDASYFIRDAGRWQLFGNQM